MRVAVYTRVSTEDQAREGFSLEVQKQVLKELIQRNGWTLACSIPNRDIYEDDGYTGSNMDRPAFKILRSDAMRKYFDLILVYKLDRLNRKLKDMLNFLEELDQLGISIKSATEPFDTTTSAGKFLIQMLGSTAEFERNRLIERVFPGMVMGVKNGHWQGARYAPYGYKYNKEIKKLEVVSDEVEVVKKIYDMYLSGSSTGQIAGHFYHQDIPTRSGGKFHSKLIGDILKNKVYLGKLVWNKHHYDTRTKTKSGKGYRYIKNPASSLIEVGGVHEPIIDENKFNRVQAKLKANKKGSGVPKFKNNIYYLSGVLYCAECGLRYHGIMIVSNHRTGGKKPWYRCLSRGYPYISCSNGQVKAEDLEEPIFEILDIIAEQLPFKEAFADSLRQASKEPAEHYSNEFELKNQLLDRNLKNQSELYDLYREQRINIEVYRQKADEMRQEETDLKKDMRALQMTIIDGQRGIEDRLRVQNFLRGLQGQGSEWSDTDKKEFMRIIFKRVVIHDGEIVSKSLEMHEPWNFLYKKGLQCQTRQLCQKRKIRRQSYVLRHSAAR